MRLSYAFCSVTISVLPISAARKRTPLPDVRLCIAHRLYRHFSVERVNEPLGLNIC